MTLNIQRRNRERLNLTRWRHNIQAAKSDWQRNKKQKKPTGIWNTPYENMVETVQQYWPKGRFHACEEWTLILLAFGVYKKKSSENLMLCIKQSQLKKKKSKTFILSHPLSQARLTMNDHDHCCLHYLREPAALFFSFAVECVKYMRSEENKTVKRLLPSTPARHANFNLELE